MILLAVVCLILYVLGAVLACEIAAEVRPLAGRIVAILFWPSLAFYLLLNSDDPNRSN